MAVSVGVGKPNLFIISILCAIDFISTGYCGADIKALCTEASLAALRRCYPQIYSSSQRYKLNVDSIVLGPQDFGRALRTIVPAAQRALAPPGRALSCTLQPLLERSLAHTLTCLLRVFPHAELLHREHTHGMESTVGLDRTYLFFVQHLPK